MGFAAANKLMKQKYEQLVQDEIESVKTAFRKEHPLPNKKSGKKPEKPRRRSASSTASTPMSWGIRKKRALPRFRSLM